MRGFRSIIACALLLSLLAAGAALPAVAQTQQAELAIEQPDYVDSDVTVTRDGGTVIYEAVGSELLIRVQNAAHGNITGVSVQNGPGAVSYDPALDLYRYQAEGEGTSTLVFAVEDNGTTAELRAQLQVSQVDWAHRTAEADQELQAAAEKWRNVESEAENVDPGSDPEEVVSDGLTWVRFIESPFANLVQSMQSILILLIFTPGGWVIGSILLGISLLGVATGARYRNRTQKQLADFGDIQVEKDQAFLEKVQSRLLQQNDWNELFPDDVARANRDLFGRNVWQGAKQFALLWSPRSVKGTVLQMMGQAGWVGYVIRDSDGGLREAGVAEGNPETYDPPAPEVDVEGISVETVDLRGLDFESDADWIDAIAWDALDDSVFQLDRDQIDIDEVSLPISNREIDDAEFMEAVNPHFPEDFEDEEHFAETCAEVLNFVIDHDHTDELGRPHEELDLLSYLAEMSSVLSDDGGFPAAHFQRKTFAWVADNLDAEDEVSETVGRISRNAAGGSESGGEPT